MGKPVKDPLRAAADALMDAVPGCLAVSLVVDTGPAYAGAITTVDVLPEQAAGMLAAALRETADRIEAVAARAAAARN